MSPSGSRSRSRSAAACARSPTREELLAAGADKVAVNSAALERPELVTELAARLGSQAVVVAIDAEGGARALARRHDGDRRATPSTGRARRERRGAGEILLTSIDADGTRDGYDLELTAAVADAVDVPVIASGGAGNAQHVATRSTSRRRRCSRRSCTRIPRGSSRCATSCAQLGVPLR